MTPDSTRIVLKVASGALRSGTDPGIVADFLDRVLDQQDHAHIETQVRSASEEFFAELDRAEINRAGNERGDKW